MTRRLPIPAIALVAVLLAAAPARADWLWPVQGEVITPYRNGDDPYAAGQHRGIDIAAETGTPVIAAAGGEVRFAGTAGSSGLTVSIRTGDGRYDTSYLHLSATAVRKGQSVAAGDRVGAVGTSGVRSATQPHLHFGVRDAGTAHGYHDPLAFLPPATVPGRPRPSPIPTTAPEPSSPEPVQVPAPVPAPGTAPRPAPAPRRSPLPRHAPLPRTSPRPAPVPHASPGHALPGGLPRHAPIPDAGPRRAPHAAPRPAPLPGTTPTPAPLSAPAALARRAPSSHPARGREPHGAFGHPPLPQAVQGPAPRSAPPRSGPDAGWALACLGLLAAAALLGLSEDGRAATRTTTRRARRRLSALVNPRFGGR
ncbi:MAG: hypothetical protein QOE60_2822 [Thermoleophilaceae bacterium]|nr:hypothetical protein [Thermoleophilaceae bacterium]